jgi:hypothetical protein
MVKLRLAFCWVMRLSVLVRAPYWFVNRSRRVIVLAHREVVDVADLLVLGRAGDLAKSRPLPTT